MWPRLRLAPRNNLSILQIATRRPAWVAADHRLILCSPLEYVAQSGWGSLPIEERRNFWNVSEQTPIGDLRSAHAGLSRRSGRAACLRCCADYHRYASARSPGLLRQYLDPDSSYRPACRGGRALHPSLYAGSHHLAGAYVAPDRRVPARDRRTRLHGQSSSPRGRHDGENFARPWLFHGGFYWRPRAGLTFRPEPGL